ncbi:MAG: hypothetical protein HY885_04205 [Deltaproteobacteria bacterium]|nr:hypothetical protein [Deltaproteobacteria bacterium]
MYKARLIFVFHLLALVMLIGGCAGVPVQENVEKHTPASSLHELPSPMAIFPFDNNAVTRNEEFEPLSAGLAAMLTTDLRSAAPDLRIIERNKISALLQEVDLSQSGYVDQATALRIGKILGAKAVVFGSFVVLGEQVRIDARVVKVETSETILTESINGTSDAFLDLEKKLASQIAGAVQKRQVAYQASSHADTLNASLFFSKGLAAHDRGDLQEAEAYFRKSIELDPSFQKQVENIRVPGN